MQRKQVVGSKLGAPGAGPLRATGFNRPGGNKPAPRLTPKERKMVFNFAQMLQEFFGFTTEACLSIVIVLLVKEKL